MSSDIDHAAAKATEAPQEKANRGGFSRRNLLLGGASLAAVTAALRSVSEIRPASAQASGKPNILVIFGDDIGYWNISAYNRGMMGYRTPNIDRIAQEGAIFTDL